MRDLRTYTALVMVPQAFKIQQPNLHSAEKAFRASLAELNAQRKYEITDNEGEPISTVAKLLYIHEGDLVAETPGEAPKAVA